MAYSGSSNCPCSNISIMQLFHELKQRYPIVPDQIVSKVIQQNCHDKSACEAILQKESHSYQQTYPGSIISGNSKESLVSVSLCNRCTVSSSLCQGSCPSHLTESCIQHNQNKFSQSQLKNKNKFLSLGGSERCNEETSINFQKEIVEGRAVRRKLNRGNTVEKEKHNIFGIEDETGKIFNDTNKNLLKIEEKNQVDEDSRNYNYKYIRARSSKAGNFHGSELFKSTTEGSDQIVKKVIENDSVNSSRTSNSACDIDSKLNRSHSYDGLYNSRYNEVETIRWSIEDRGRKSGGSSGKITRPVSGDQGSMHNYQVAVQYSMQPALPTKQNEQPRSFTSVNLSLRPPSSEPQPFIEIQSGQNLTYTSSVFDAEKGVQSQFQIMIGTGGVGTVSACRNHIISLTKNSCSSSHFTPQMSTGNHFQNNQRLKALLEKQRERKNLLAIELQKEKEKLRIMQNKVRLMKASIFQIPSFHFLPKLKADIDRLRYECDRLASEVDLFSDTQNKVPLGETDEEFYRNIYTGQRLEREGSWSCQLCTFRNHPLLSVCEECEMPRISLGTQVMDVASHLSNVLSNNNTPFCMEGGTSASASLITAPLQVFRAAVGISCNTRILKLK